MPGRFSKRLKLFPAASAFVLGGGHHALCLSLSSLIPGSAKRAAQYSRILLLKNLAFDPRQNELWSCVPLFDRSSLRHWRQMLVFFFTSLGQNNAGCLGFSQRLQVMVMG